MLLHEPLIVEYFIKYRRVFIIAGRCGYVYISKLHYVLKKRKLRPKMRQNALSGRACPDPLGELERSPDLLTLTVPELSSTVCNARIFRRIGVQSTHSLNVLRSRGMKSPSTTSTDNTRQRVKQYWPIGRASINIDNLVGL